MQFTIHDLESKLYAVVVLHDENGNADVDMQGAVPTEGYAFSQGAGQYATPSFKEASFEVTDENSTIMTTLVYLKR